MHQTDSNIITDPNQWTIETKTQLIGKELRGG